MTQLTASTLESLLSEYGWSFEAVGDNQWTTGFQGEDRVFPLLIRLSTTCVSFEVRPLIEAKLDLVHWPELSRDLLELNARMQLVKLALTDEGEVCLSCQVLAAGFNFEMLSRILGIIGYYAGEIAPEIGYKVAVCGRSERPSFLS